MSLNDKIEVLAKKVNKTAGKILPNGKFGYNFLDTLKPGDVVLKHSIQIGDSISVMASEIDDLSEKDLESLLKARHNATMHRIIEFCKEDMV